jgi:hypothetical protein
MTISTVYALAMPKFVYVQIVGLANTLKIRADKIERDGQEYKLRLGDSQVGVFSYGAVQGWWIQDEPEARGF